MRMLPRLVVVFSLCVTLSGCVQLLEKTHIRAADNDAFFPFMRASVNLDRGSRTGADPAAPDAQARHTGPTLRQGNTALDLDLAQVEGKNMDEDGNQRTFAVDVYSLALRGSTRPERFWGLYLDGFIGYQRVNMRTAADPGMDATAQEGGLLFGFGLGYAFTDDLTVHARRSAGAVSNGALVMQEFLATYWFTPHVGLSGGYRSWNYFNELILLGFDFKWSGPAAGLVVAF